MDIGCYCVNAARLMAGEPELVTAMAVSGGDGVDLRFAATMQMPGGVLAHFDCGFDFAFGHGLEVVGQRGTLTLRDPWHGVSPGLELRTDSGEERIDVEGSDPYRLQAENFSAAVQGRAPLLIGPDEIVAQASAIEALYAAAQPGRAVRRAPRRPDAKPQVPPGACRDPLEMLRAVSCRPLRLGAPGRNSGAGRALKRVVPAGQTHRGNAGGAGGSALRALLALVLVLAGLAVIAGPGLASTGPSGGAGFGSTPKSKPKPRPKAKRKTKAKPRKTTGHIKPAPEPLKGVADLFAGRGMWIGYVSASNGGNLSSIIAEAKARGISTLMIKSGDGTNVWSQSNPTLVSTLHAAGLRVCAWQYVYGNHPLLEAQVGAAAVKDGADCLLIDAEVEYEGKYVPAQTYITQLRTLIGANFPVALAGFPYVDYHPAFPYLVFLGPGRRAVQHAPDVLAGHRHLGRRGLRPHAVLQPGLRGRTVIPLG